MVLVAVGVGVAVLTSVGVLVSVGVGVSVGVSVGVNVTCPVLVAVGVAVLREPSAAEAIRGRKLEYVVVTTSPCNTVTSGSTVV
jgi:hypothetical protein